MAGLDLSVFLVNFVSDQDNGDVVADSGEVLIPFGDVLIGDSGGDVEHENSGIGTNIVTLTKSSEFFLSGSVPEGKFDRSVVGVEGDGADLNSLGGDILLLKLTGDVSFDEGGLADSTVSD